MQSQHNIWWERGSSHSKLNCGHIQVEKVIQHGTLKAQTQEVRMMLNDECGDLVQ